MPTLVRERRSIGRRVVASRWSVPLILILTLTCVAVASHGGRLGTSLAGGALAPVMDLGMIWTEYLGAWHGVAGGTGSSAPMAWGVLGVAGVPLLPWGGPPAVVAVLLIGHVPLAGMVAYTALRGAPVRRVGRAVVAAAYGVLPAAGAGAAQGRVDVAVVHVLLPALLAGIATAVHRPRRSARGRTRWLSVGVSSALGVAAVSSFLPFVYVLVVVGAVVAFATAPLRHDRPLGRAAALAVVVLLPLGLALPWLPVLSADPALVFHGVGGPVASTPGIGELLGLDPGGPGAAPTGYLLVAAAGVAVFLRPGRRMLPAFGVTALGAFGTVVLATVTTPPLHGGAPSPGFTGVPLLLVGAGLLLVVLTAVTEESGGRRCARVRGPVAFAAVVGLAVLGVVTAVEGREGPLRRHEPDDGRWAAELTETGAGVLVLDAPGAPGARLTAGRLPRFGDEALVPGPGATAWLAELRHGLLAGQADAALAAGAAGVRFVVVPGGNDGARIRRALGELADDVGRTAQGRMVLRLRPGVGPTALVSSDQADRAVRGETPDAELLRPPGSVTVAAAPPEVALRASDGPEGRLLVLAARPEPGWRAVVDDSTVPVVSAWNGQVAVALPPEAAEVRVWYDSRRHDLLVLGQLAVVLFAVVAALPIGGRARGVNRRR